MHVAQALFTGEVAEESVVRVVTENLGGGKGGEARLLDEGGQAALEIWQGYLIDEDAVKRLHEESPIEPGNKRGEVFVRDATGVRHYRAHFADNGLQELCATAKPSSIVALAGLLQAAGGPGIIFSSVDHTVWQGGVD